mmetsp:Transcript_571/g.1281  ORF Transcript_571/g.1281 Transcript_571/m.1281 type:complete len:209 (+) Transcript_571:995-1621(+)
MYVRMVGSKLSIIVRDILLISSEMDTWLPGDMIRTRRASVLAALAAHSASSHGCMNSGEVWLPFITTPFHSVEGRSLMVAPSVARPLQQGTTRGVVSENHDSGRHPRMRWATIWSNEPWNPPCCRWERMASPTSVAASGIESLCTNMTLASIGRRRRGCNASAMLNRSPSKTSQTSWSSTVLRLRKTTCAGSSSPSDRCSWPSASICR